MENPGSATGQVKVRLNSGQCQVNVRSRSGQGARMDGLDLPVIQEDLIHG